jgi:hypothetical protein
VAALREPDYMPGVTAILYVITIHQINDVTRCDRFYGYLTVNGRHRDGFPCQKESPRRKAGAKPEDLMKVKGIGQSLHAQRYDENAKQYLCHLRF